MTVASEPLGPCSHCGAVGLDHAESCWTQWFRQPVNTAPQSLGDVAPSLDDVLAGRATVAERTAAVMRWATRHPFEPFTFHGPGGDPIVTDWCGYLVTPEQMCGQLATEHDDPGTA